MADPIRVLGLFAGIGGLERGVAAGLRDVGLDARVVGLVEGEAFGAACLGAAMRRGELAACPIWLGDVREFPASAFAGAVDLVCAGFPCQPASSAGKRRGTDDERWLWPEVVRVARESRARYVFCENVRGLLNVNGGEGFAQVLEGLADLGFDAEWTCLPASAVGAPHRRERVFILGRRDVADGDGSGRERERMPSPDEQRAPRDEPHGRGWVLGDAAGEREREPHDAGGAESQSGARESPRWTGGIVADAKFDGREGREREVVAGPHGRGHDSASLGPSGWPLPWPPGPGERELWQRIIAADPGIAPAVVGDPERGGRGNRAPERSEPGHVPPDACRAGCGDRAEAWRRDEEASAGIEQTTAEPDLRRVAHGVPEGTHGPGDVGFRLTPDELSAAECLSDACGCSIAPCSDGDPDRFDVSVQSGAAGLCVSHFGLARWIEDALADGECGGLGERTVEALVQCVARWRGLPAPRGSGRVHAKTDRSARVDRLRALGNAVVAAQARYAFAGLWRRLA